MKKSDKLRPEHFRWRPEKPKKEDYINICGYPGHCRDCADESDDDCGYKVYHKNLDEWNSKYGDKPEPEWKRFDAHIPEIGQIIHASKSGEVPSVWNVCYGMDERAKKPDSIKYWCDAKSYDEKLSLWQYHQKRYEGWQEEFHNTSTIKGRITAFRKESILVKWVHFPINPKFLIWDFSDHHGVQPFYNKGIPSIQLFELICKETRIQL